MTDSILLAYLITSDLLIATESQNSLKEQLMHIWHKAEISSLSHSQEHIECQQISDKAYSK